MFLLAVLIVPLAIAAVAPGPPPASRENNEGRMVVTSTTRVPVTPQAMPQFLIAPRPTDLNSGGFRVSWVADQAVTATLYWANVPNPAAWNTTSDPPPATNNGAVVLVTTGVLATETDYYWRARQTNGAETSWYPSSTTTVTTRTEQTTTVSCGQNPRIEAGPFYDGNANGIFDGQPIDQPQFRFLVFLSHTDAGSLSSRGGENDPYFWNATLDTERLIWLDPSTDYHCAPDHHVAGTAQFGFTMHGLYDDGAGRMMWENTTAVYTWPPASPLFPEVYYPTSVPQLTVPLAAAAAITMLLVLPALALGKRPGPGARPGAVSRHALR